MAQTSQQQLQGTLQDIADSILSLEREISLISRQFDENLVAKLRQRVDSLKSAYATYSCKLSTATRLVSEKQSDIQTLQHKLRVITAQNDEKSEKLSRLRADMRNKLPKLLPTTSQSALVLEDVASSVISPPSSIAAADDSKSLHLSPYNSTVSTAEEVSSLSDATPSSNGSLPRNSGKKSENGETVVGELSNPEYVVVAVRSYEAETQQELQFSGGDEIRVLQCNPDG